jgi:hypothetical protein
MGRLNWRAVALAAVLGVVVATPPAQAVSHRKANPSQQGGMRTPAEGLTAKLVDAEKKAQEKAATVQVQVSGVKLIDPAAAKEQPRKGQGHLHYRVDGGPVIATTSTKLSFHELTSGEHKIVVTLAANDHKPPVSVRIP